jgi:hypothetical protein
VALDASDHPVLNYAGTVHFASTDSAANLPPDFTFTLLDHGFHVFQVSLQTLGSQTITVTDTAHISITGSTTVMVLASFGVVTHFRVLVPPAVAAGITVPVGVVALDAANHPVVNYIGTVHFTSTDSAASLPADYTFTLLDHGVHIFPVTLQTAGSQTITVTDAARSSTTGSATVLVITLSFGPADHFGVFASPTVPAGIPFPVGVVALDASNHPVLNYTGTVHFTSTDSAANLPADFTFTLLDHGFHVFQVSVQTPGSQTVTVTDTAHSSITGSATIVVRHPLVVDHFGVLTPPAVQAGSPFPVGVVALDASGDPVPTYTGTVHFTSSDSAANLPADFTFTASDHGVHVFATTFQTTGRQTLTVADTSNNSISGAATVNVFTHIRIWLNQVYQSLLGRPLDPVGELNWTGALAGGASLADVAQAIESSSEYRTRLIDNLYATLLGRAPDPFGLNNFLAAMNSGMTVEQVKTSLLSSAEYFSRAGGTNTAFVDALYHDALGRAVDPLGGLACVALLNLGADRNVVASAIVTSNEANQDLVQQDYLQFLGRPVDAVGLSACSGALQQGMRDEAILAGIIGSGEFFQGL